MGQTGFFGELSPFEIIASIGGLIGGGFAVYSIIRAQLLPARVELKVADTVDLVLGTDGLISAFHLACSFENRGARTGTVQRMAAKVVNPDNESCEFGWFFFVGYQPGGNERVKLRDRHAIAVRKDETEFTYIEFRRPGDSCADFRWVPGEYTFEISAWVNAKKPTEDPQTKRVFRAQVPGRLASEVGRQREGPNFCAIEISDWAPNT